MKKIELDEGNKRREEGATEGMLMSDAMLNAIHSSIKAMGRFHIGSTCVSHTIQTSSNRSHEKTWNEMMRTETQQHNMATTTRRTESVHHPHNNNLCLHVFKWKANRHGGSISERIPPQWSNDLLPWHTHRYYLGTVSHTFNTSPHSCKPYSRVSVCRRKNSRHRYKIFVLQRECAI